ncbi:MAG: dephospho-CoA kinase [Flavobacteriales bacterium]|nr:dephospho-CoA kinase [Flavobacteriales bacterium]
MKSKHLHYMKVVGLTGGIGSGKSSIARVFKSMGVPIYIADERAKALYSSSKQLKHLVIERFGEAVYLNGSFSPAALAQKVFGDDDALSALNAMVHPLVKEDFSQWLKEQSASYVIREAAILFESASHLDCHAVITVEANETERIERVMKRDERSEAEVRQRINKQWTDAQRREKADLVIVNNNNSLILERCYLLHQEFSA